MVGQISKKKKIIIEFSNIETDKEISDDLFIFRVPKGVYVYNNPIGW
jgi:outer membrane lipoprotein-sorting protein